VPLVMQFNMRDLAGSLPLGEMTQVLNPDGRPAFPANARQGEGVLETLRSVSHLVLSRLVKRK
jgi:mutual gliding-motility protein MglA